MRSKYEPTDWEAKMLDHIGKYGEDAEGPEDSTKFTKLRRAFIVDCELMVKYLLNYRNSFRDDQFPGFEYFLFGLKIFASLRSALRLTLSHENPPYK